MYNYKYLFGTTGNGWIKYTYIYRYICIYISEENKGQEIHKPLNLLCLLWIPSNCCQFGYWNHSLSFSKHNNFAASAFWNRTCDMKIAPAKWRSQMRFEVADAFWNRRCVLKTHLRPELRRCDFRIAGAKLTSQLRSAARLWHLLNSIDLSHRSHTLSDKYRTMHHFVTEMCTHVHICVTKQYIFALWDMGLLYWGICG